MLKITKGLKPFIEEGVSTYTDSKGNRYVRVKMDGEDFCIASQDYVKEDKDEFIWDEAMAMVKKTGMTMFTKEQVTIYKEHFNEINEMFEEIGGNKLKKAFYWTSSKCNESASFSWTYYGGSGYIDDDKTYIHYRVRPIINLQ